MVREMNELLKELGWADGFRVPVADKENKELENQVEALIKEKANLILKFDSAKESVSALQRQLQNYTNEEIENQVTVTARRHQLEDEYTKLRVCESEICRLNRETSQTVKAISDLNKKQLSIQNEISNMMSRLDKLKRKVHGGEEALGALAELTAKGCDDNSILQKFCREDEARFLELETERLRLKKEVIEREKILETIISETHASQLQVEQCGKFYRRLLKGYRESVKFWNASIEHLKQRDKTIRLVYKDITAVKSDAVVKYKELYELHKFIEVQKKNNNEVEALIPEVEKDNCIVKQAIIKVVEDSEEYAKQIHIYRYSLSAVGTKLLETRSLSSSSVIKLEAKHSEIQRAKDYNTQLNYQYTKLKLEANSHADSNSQLEDIAKELEKSIGLVMKDIDKLNGLFMSQQRELSDWKEKALLITNEIGHCQTAVVCLNKEGVEVNQMINHEQEILYKYKFDVATLETNIARLEGEEDLAVKEKHLNKIKELEVILKEKSEAFNLINGQLRFSEDEIRKITAEYDRGEIEMQRLISDRWERTMNVEGGFKKLQSIQELNKELNVEQNLLELQVQQFENLLKKQDKAVFNHEKQRLELDAAMKERRLLIQSEKDVLLIKKKVLQEERSELKRSVEHLNAKRYQVQNRFEIAADMLGKKPEDDDASSVTYCKIKLAQERNELQERGDELDAKIRKSEKEILAMENTLRLLSATNDSYKQNLSSVEEDSPEMEEKKLLEAKYVAAAYELKQQQNVLKNLNASIKALDASLDESETMEEKLQAEWKIKDKETRELDKELEDQQEKLSRAEKQFKKAVSDVRSMRDSKIPIEFAERDIEVRELQDINNNAIQLLQELATRYVETSPTIYRYLDEKNLQYRSRQSLVKNKRLSDSLLSVTPSTSELGGSSSRLSAVSERSSELSMPSIINLDPFSKVCPPVMTSSGCLQPRKSKNKSSSGSISGKNSFKSCGSIQSKNSYGCK